MSDLEDEGAVVLDIGSGTLRAGIAGNDAPNCIMSTVVGQPKEDYHKCPAVSSVVGQPKEDYHKCPAVSSVVGQPKEDYHKCPAVSSVVGQPKEDYHKCPAVSSVVGQPKEDYHKCPAVSSVVGQPKEDYHKCPAVMGIDDNYIGDYAQQHRGILSLKYPIDKGVVTDWDSMEMILHDVFNNHLRIKSEDHHVLISEPPLNPKHNKETMSQVLFEKFQVPGFYASNQGLLSCYASGRGSALMLDVGNTMSHLVPVYEGHCLQPAIRRVDYGGKDITIYLQKLLNEKSPDFVTTADFEIVREIKEAIGFVSEDYKEDVYKAEVFSSIDQSYTLPDGKEIVLGKERFFCTEPLFHSLPDIGFDGLHKMAWESINAMDMDVRQHYHFNIVISGGTTMFRGFTERFQKEMGSLLYPSCNGRFRVVSPPERKYSVWIGGSILASLTTFQNWWVSRQEYEEHGPDIVNKKCY